MSTRCYRGGSQWMVDKTTKDEFIFMSCRADCDYYATVENNNVTLTLE